MRLTPELSDRDVGKTYRRFLKWTRQNTWIDKIDKRRKMQKLSGLDLYGQYWAQKNPLLVAIEKYLSLESSAQSVRKHVDPEMAEAAGYLMVINEIAHKGDDSVRRRLMGFLLDDNAVKAFLFEVQLAIHFFHRGHDVQFMDLEDKAHYDLLVSNGSEEIEVECKRKSADAGRKINRADFYLLADILFARLHQINKRFVVLVESEGPMGGNTSLFYEIANAIEKSITTSKSEDQIKPVRRDADQGPARRHRLRPARRNARAPRS